MWKATTPQAFKGSRCHAGCDSCSLASLKSPRPLESGASVTLRLAVHYFAFMFVPRFLFGKALRGPQLLKFCTAVTVGRTSLQGLFLSRKVAELQKATKVRKQY